MKYLLIVFIIIALALLVEDRIDRAHSEGFKLGMTYALKRDPPSEELEMACLGLWLGEQNRKWYEKNK